MAAPTPPPSIPLVRRGEPSDLDAIRTIQKASPEAAHWDVSEYLHHDLRVAVHGARIAGFLVTRTLAPGESEILNLAVAPESRRHGVALALLAAYLRHVTGEVYLEVRASNEAAQEFYKSLGFKAVTQRREYYSSPMETAIVMKFHSC